jgi:hypothetical protein
MSVNSNRKYFDPLAQSFFVDDPLGVYVTKVGLFFASKSTTLPVTIELRPANGSQPDSIKVLADSTVSLPPNGITTSNDATAETIFTFDEPIFLSPNSWYAIVVKTYASNDYTIYTSKFGDFVLNSTAKRITKDLEAGVFFKSSNSSTWTPDQEMDLKYNLYRAVFSGTAATAVFRDANTPKYKLLANSLSTVSGSPTITVYQPNHGFIVGDVVNISGLTAATSYNGITGNKINGSRIISAIDGNSYQFPNLDNTIPTSTGSFGGNSVIASQHYQLDVAQIQIQESKPAGTDITYTGAFTTSQSLAAQNETAYGTTNVSLVNQKDYYFKQPHVIMNDSNEIVQISDRESTTITASLQSPLNNSFVAPSIDLQRASILGIHNLIDNQDASNTVGYNIPLKFVDETDAYGGTALAKHVTKVVSLAESAVGIKIIFDGTRPSNANFRVFYRTLETGSDADIANIPWTEEEVDQAMPSDDNGKVYREYRYTVGGEFIGSLPKFTKYQIKIVMNSKSSSAVPKIKNLRTIALGI